MKKSPMGLPAAAACVLAAASGLATISWRDGHPLAEGVAGGAIACMEKNIVYAGGTTWCDGVKHWLCEVWRYSPKSDSWISEAALPEPLAFGAYVQSDGSLQIFGGASEKGVSRNCWRLERGAPAWKSCGVLPESAVFAGAASVDGGNPKRSATVWRAADCSVKIAHPDRPNTHRERSE
jgi:N-acetylneuraminic acid mutarotase